jgi:hypothetical protein
VIDPLAEKYGPFNPHNYVMNNPVRMIDPDGNKVDDIIIKAKHGDETNYVQRTFNLLQENTSAKLDLNVKTGEVTIVSSTGGNENAHPLSSEMVNGLIESKHTVTITNDSPRNLNIQATTTPINAENAMKKGVGTGSKIEFSPDVKINMTLTNGVEKPAPAGRVLEHELIHAEHNDQGTKLPSEVEDGQKLGPEERQTRDKENLLNDDQRAGGNPKSK